MKTSKITFVSITGIALLVTSCLNERELFIGEMDKDDIGFKLASVQTKASAKDFFISTPEKLTSFKASTGDTFVFEEEVISLDAAPATKGTPAFTENVATLYGSFNAIANPGTANEVEDAAYAFNASTNYWTHKFTSEIWKKAPFTFYMRMPSTPGGVTSDYTYGTNKIEFDYTSPATAALQQDILFASTTMSGESENGKDVTFYHALTGIKFSNFYTNDGIDGAQAVTKTIIKEVTLAGLKNTGHCTMDFTALDSLSRSVAKWSNQTGSATFSLSVSDTTNYGNSTYGLDTLLNTTAKARNLNVSDGSLTFWVVPQEFEDSTVMITMKCDIVLDKGNNGGATTTVSDTTITVSLGARNWKGGELHTFTLKPVIVGVELEDHMSDDGFVKSNVRVDNTGNVFEYVRVNMIGNWVGEVQTAENVFDNDEVILMGFTTSDPEDTTEVEFWNDKDGKTNYGTFVNLTPQSHQVPAVNGQADSIVNGWVRYDKYYYYTKPIGPNDAITDQLFQSYTVGPSPEFWIADKWGERRKARNVHLVIDLMVQAIPAPVDVDGNVLDNEDNEGYIRAWLEALDFEPTKANYVKLLDL